MNQAELQYNFIAIEGNIGAGKTTLAKILHEEFKSDLILEQFSDNPFLSNFYENPERHAFAVELFFMAERHKQFQEYFGRPQLFSNQLVVSDYIFEKTVLFANNNLSGEEFRLFQRLFAALKSNFPEPDILIYLYRDIPFLMDNINSRGRSYEQQISPEYLSEIQSAYLNYFKSIVKFPVLVIDIEDLDFTNDEIFLQRIKQRLSTKYENGVHFIK